MMPRAFKRDTQSQSKTTTRQDEEDTTLDRISSLLRSLSLKFSRSRRNAKDISDSAKEAQLQQVPIAQRELEEAVELCKFTKTLAEQQDLERRSRNRGGASMFPSIEQVLQDLKRLESDLKYSKEYNSNFKRAFQKAERPRDVGNIRREIRRTMVLGKEATRDFSHSELSTLVPLKTAIARGTPKESWIANTARHGFGSFGQVYCAKLYLFQPGQGDDGSNGVLDVAVKGLLVKSPDHKKDALMRWRREQEVWMRLSHRNILQFLGDFGLNNTPTDDTDIRDSEPVYLVSVWAAGRDVTSYLAGPFGENQSYKRTQYGLSLVQDIIDGLEYLHDGEYYDPDIGPPLSDVKYRVTHNDLHPNNVLVHLPESKEGPPIACLADFGLSVMTKTAATHVGHEDYRAPEIQEWLLNHPTRTEPRELLSIEEKRIDEEERKQRSDLLEKGDVYSFGAVAYHILTGENMVGGWEKLQDLLGPGASRPQEISPPVFELLQACCAENPQNRPTMKEVADRFPRQRTQVSG